MAILIANIGTSDLAVKVENFYLPVGFERNEPGIDYTGLTEEEKTAWNNREELLAQHFFSKLGIKVTERETGKYLFSFREITQNILRFYQANPEKWQAKNWRDKFVPIRILGAIQKAYQDFQVRTAYIFITNQNPEHHQDTIYLFEILKLWFEEKFEGLRLHGVIIPDSIKPVDQDVLLNYYYGFFNTLDPQDTILVSIKGGTPQMQNALKLQAIASGIQRLLFIDPILSVKQILAGKASECKLTSYWQYFRQQKYQTVQQLLERWDFDGAINLLNQWRKVLTFLEEHQVINSQEIVKSGNNLDKIIAVLKCACSLLDLDAATARKIIEANPILVQSEGLTLAALIESKNGNTNYDSLLNLYTQCLIDRDLRQVGNLLTTLSSFYEGILYRIIEKNGGFQYLTPNDRLKVHQLKQDIGNQLTLEFKTAIAQLTDTQLSSRRQLRTFITIILKHRWVNKSLVGVESWETDRFQLTDGKTIAGVNGLLETLDYWIAQRNKLIHDLDGISINRIHELDRNRLPKACAYQQIPEVMEKLLTHRLLGLKNLHKKQFVGTNEYYIYTNVREWAIANLLSEINLVDC